MQISVEESEMDAGMVPLCEYRQKRFTWLERGETRAEFVCHAAGGEHLAWVGSRKSAP